MKILIPFTFIVLVNTICHSQTNSELAEEKKKEAIEFMDNGNTDEAIKLLNEAKSLDPNNYSYDYEIAYSYYIKQEYKTAIKIMIKLMDYKDIPDFYYQMLGNLYDMDGKSDKAIETYDTGLLKFPSSGRLYLEKGNVYWGKEKYIEALQLYEEGIKIDPAFSSNYYRAALIYLNSSEKLWGMIYAEIFMNLERNSQRTNETSKILFDVYKSQIQFVSDTSISISFSQNSTISTNDLKEPENFKLPYGIGIYEPNLLKSIVNEDSVTLASLDRIRTRFLENYYLNKYNEKYPNILFDYNKKINDSGHFQSYNYWLLLGGNINSFTEWKDENKEKWDNFVTWFTDNPLELSQTNKFFTGQY